MTCGRLMLHNVKPEVIAFATPPMIPDEVVMNELVKDCMGIFVCCYWILEQTYSRGKFHFFIIHLNALIFNYILQKIAFL